MKEIKSSLEEYQWAAPETAESAEMTQEVEKELLKYSSYPDGLFSHVEQVLNQYQSSYQGLPAFDNAYSDPMSSFYQEQQIWRTPSFNPHAAHSLIASPGRTVKFQLCPCTLVPLPAPDLQYKCQTSRIFSMSFEELNFARHFQMGFVGHEPNLSSKSFDDCWSKWLINCN